MPYWQHDADYVYVSDQPLGGLVTWTTIIFSTDVEKNDGRTRDSHSQPDTGVARVHEWG